jgi:activator of HSP90 ATPase
LGAGGLAIAAGQSAAGAAQEAIRAAKSIHHEIELPAAPRRIYEILLDSKQFAAFSGGRAAEIHPEAGGTFSIFAGHIVGRNIEVVPGVRIVQAWRVVNWPAGLYSLARFEMKAQGAGTMVVFDHTGFPPESAESLESGWHENYWSLLRKYLG